VAKNPKAVFSMIDQARVYITDAKHNPSKTAKLVREFYKNLKANNDIQGLHPILPDGTLAMVTDSQLDWMNQVRWIIDARLASIRRAPFYDSSDFQDLILTLATLYPGNDYRRESRLTAPKSVTGMVSRSEPYAALCKYVSSTAFGYFPALRKVSVDAHRDHGIPETQALRDPDDLDVYNPAGAKTSRLLSIQQRAAPATISEGEKARLVCLAKSGGLSDFLDSLVSLRESSGAHPQQTASAPDEST
jgi:hypothetical protein